MHKFPLQKYFPSNSYQEFLDVYINPEYHDTFLEDTSDVVTRTVKDYFNIGG